VAIWQHYKRVLSIFSSCMRRNGYLWTSGQKSEPAIRSGTSISYMTDAFPLPSDVYWIYSMFLCYYVAWHCDLDLWPFDLESVSCTVLLMSDPYTKFYYPTTIGYWVTSTDPNLPIHFVTFTALRRRLSHAMGKKIAFSHYEGYKVYCVCAVSRDLCIGDPPKAHVTIFDPELPIHYTTFIRLRWRLRVRNFKNVDYFCPRLEVTLHGACAVTVSDNGNVIRYSVLVTQ